MAFFLKYNADLVTSMFFSRERPWQVMAADKRKADIAKIIPEWILSEKIIQESRSRDQITGAFFESLLDEETSRITTLDVNDLVDGMRTASLTAVQVVTAFSKRAAYAHQLTNNMLEIGFGSALERAKELDQYFQKEGKLSGPLHGVPLTLKDQFHIKDLGTTMGYVGWIDTFEGKRGSGKEKVFESELIKELHSLGAIPLGKTTLVTSLWSPETNNNILGYLWNPYNQRLSSGGSSGGEAVMQALHGSAFGIGTDIGGSVTMPSSYNGIFSLKPSSGRMSMKGAANTGQGQQVMPTAVGIMGHSVATLRLVLESLLSTKPWLRDPYVYPIPWREPIDTNQAAFGFLEHDDLVHPHPPVARALRTVREALQDAGYELLDWEPPSSNYSNAIHGPIARGDGCPDVWHALQLSGEPPVPQIASLFEGGRPKPPMPLPQYEDVVIKMKDYRAAYQEYWMESVHKTQSGRPVRAVIQPVSPYAGVLPGKFLYSAYSSGVNVLDYPAVVIPVTVADREKDTINRNFHALTDVDRRNMEAYDPSAYHGGPAAIQIIGLRLEEEDLLASAQLVVEALEKYKKKHGI